MPQIDNPSPEATELKGLSPQEVASRISQGQANTPVEPPSKSIGQIIFSNVFTYFNLIFAILAAMLLTAGLYKDLVFLPLIICNSAIGIFQELRSKRLLDQLTVLNSPTAKVIRNGQEQKIASDQLVLDDIVLFKAGDQIPADAEVISGKASVNESLLTGESDEIIKEPGAELMSGSFIVSGSCYARLTHVGAESYISKLTLQAKTVNGAEESEMLRSMNKLLKIAGVILIPLGGLMFYQNFFITHLTFAQSVKTTVAAVIGMIPEGLFLLCSVTLALSAMRLAKQKVLVHDMKCIETLARVNVLCVDKTGTITENTMCVTDVIPLGDTDKATLTGLLSDFAAEQSADNITMSALKQYFTTPTGAKIVSHTDFSSEFKYSSVTCEKAAYILGAPERILREKYEQFREEIEFDSRKGYRVLAFARYSGKPDGKALTEDCEPLALVLITNPIRESAPTTFKFFENEGVEVKVISGDNPITVSEVAKQAGVANADKYVDASTLTTDESIAEAMKNYTVFGRVTPDQKRKFVRALQAQDKTVAMTGDGVNDILALKDADCSVAMASGSDAAVHTAQLVLLDSDFSHMTDVVMEGRQCVNNLERSGSLFMVKNIFSVLLTIVALIQGITYPLTPSQITLISTFTIGLPAFLLSQVPDHFMIKGKFAQNVVQRALPGALTDLIVVMAMVTFGKIFEVSQEEITTASTLLLSIVGFLFLRHICKPHTAFKSSVRLLCIAGLLFAFRIFDSVFDMEPLSTQGWLLTINFGIMADTFMRLIRYLLYNAEKMLLKMNIAKKESGNFV
ncbi:MAG: cation-translocating P-type ATPase [Oscillospiraceae bacterium]|nr:cation-translocating P-type ATPase [Oscillospiraceae bacterium]